MPKRDTPMQDSDTLTLWPLPDIKHVYLLAAGIFLGVMLGPAVLGRALPAQYEQWFNDGGDTAQLDQALAQAQEMMEKPESFVLSPDVEAEITRYETLAREALEQQLETMRDIEVTPQAIEEHRAQAEQAILDARVNRVEREHEQKLQSHRQHIGILSQEIKLKQHAHRLKLIGIQMALILALVAFAIAEALFAPTPRDDTENQETPSGGVSPRLAHLVTVRYALLAGWLTLTIAQPAAIKAVSPVFAGLLLVVVLVAGFVPLGKRA